MLRRRGPLQALPLHRQGKDRHRRPELGRLPDCLSGDPHQHVRLRRLRRARVQHDLRLRRHPLGQWRFPSGPVRAWTEPHRPQPMGGPAALHRQLSRLLRRPCRDAPAHHGQRRRRRRALVPGHRDVYGPASPAEARMDATVQRRGPQHPRPQEPQGHHQAPPGLL